MEKKGGGGVSRFRSGSDVAQTHAFMKKSECNTFMRRDGVKAWRSW